MTGGAKRTRLIFGGLIGLLLAPQASAQRGEIVAATVARAIKLGRESGRIPPLSQTLPVGEQAATGSSWVGSSGRGQPGEAFPAPVGDDNKILRIVQAGSGGQRGALVQIREGAELVYRGYRCLADEVDGNTETQQFTFRGNVRVIGADTTLTGDSVTVNFKERSFVSNFGRAEIQPSQIGNLVTSPIYVKGRQAGGTSSRLLTSDCEFTTCDRKEAHFHFDAATSVIEPGRQAVLRKVDIEVLGKRLVRLPALWIPLGERSFKYLPQFGQTPDEGYYIKNRYGFPLAGEDRGVARLDYLSKLGTGLGGEYFYRSKASNGIAKAYRVFGQANTLNVTSQHEQRFGFGTLQVDSSLQRNNYLTAPSTTLLATRGTLRLSGDSTLLTFNNQSQQSRESRSNNQTLGLTDQRRWGKSSSALDLTLAGNSFTSAASPGANTKRETLDVRYRYSQDTAKGTASLDYQRTIPIGDVSNFFPASDKTPVLSFATDSGRLFGRETRFPFPFRTEISSGEYLDPITRRRITRHSFDLNWNRARRDTGALKWDLNGGFRQGLYSDDTAQYRLNLGSALTYDLGKRSKINLRYTYLRPFGFTPLAIDRTGISNFASLDVSAFANRRSSFGIQTGYDFERSAKSQLPWQQVGIRSEYRVDEHFSLRTLTTYDAFEQRWSNIRLDANWRGPSLYASLGARYDGIRQAWSNLNAFVDGIEYGKTRFGTVLNFNGYTGRLDAQQYNFIYNLHCAEAVLTVSDFGSGFRSGREIGFFIRLKAVPFDSNFGLGRRGQVLGSGTGRDF